MGLMNSFFNWYHENGIIPNLWKGATGQLSQEKINDENIQYQKERNEIEDARYEDETAYNRAWSENERNYQRGRDMLANRRYNDETSYNRAFAENERAYQRAFASEEQAYNRAWSENERAYNREWALNQRDYERNLQQQIFEREDTAIARQANALREQGINPLSQSMNGLGSGSLVSATPSGSTGYSGSSSGSSSAPSSIGYSGGSPTSAPALSGRQGKALQKAMITSQGINGLLGPILQTMNTIDNLRGSGLQRDILNANAIKAQAEANMTVMNMFDTSNRLNIPNFSFKYGVNGKKQTKQTNNAYDPYTYTPQEVHFFENQPKRLQSLIATKQSTMLDSFDDGVKFLTSKLKNIDGLETNDKVINSFASIIESLIMKAFR